MGAHLASTAWCGTIPFVQLTLNNVLASVLCIGAAAAIGSSAPTPNTWSDALAPSTQNGGWQAGAEKMTCAWARTATGAYVARFDLTLKPGWHSYWQNPGGSGDAPSATWSLPQGWKAGAIQFPRPEAKIMDELPFYGYEGKATFLVQIAPDASAPAPTSAGGAGAAPEGRWHASCTVLVCKDKCVLGTFNFTGEWPPSAPKGAVDLSVERFNERALPMTATAAGLITELQGDILRISGPARGTTSVAFIPANAPGLSLAEPSAAKGVVTGTVKDGRFELLVPFERTAVDNGGRLPDAEGLVLLGKSASDPCVYVRVSSGQGKPTG